MLKYNTLIISSFLFVSNANAGFLADQAPACITYEKMQEYIIYTQADAASFVKNTLDRADCYINHGHQPAMQEAASDGLVKVKLESGHTVWTQPENYLTTWPEPTAVTE